MENKPNYYAIIPANVRYADITPNAKLLYAEITALSNKDGYCYATNNYFAELYNVSKVSISKWISELVNAGFIKSEITYKQGTKEIDKRYLTIINEDLNKTLIPVKENFEGGIKEKFKENNTRDNNTSINNIKEKNEEKKGTDKERFVKPSIDEIKSYCLERNNGIDAEYFYDFYESRGWLIGKNKVKDWRACIRTWEKRSHTNGNNFTGKYTQKPKSFMEDNYNRAMAYNDDDLPF